MLKIKEVVNQMNDIQYQTMVNEFNKTKARNYLFLLTQYRTGNLSENAICKELDLTNNAFYALKSRLYDKIQNHLSAVKDLAREEILKELSKINDICCFESRETSNMKLQHLEQDLIKAGMHNELLLVYSALKKIHANTNKYYHYSQLYNKEVAFSLSLEKAEDTLISFTKYITEYELSKNKNLLEPINFLVKEINNIADMNSSNHILIVKLMIEVQHRLFCFNPREYREELDDLFKQTQAVFERMAKADYTNAYKRANSYLFLVYLIKTNQKNQAIKYFNEVKEYLPYLFLHNHIVCSHGVIINVLRLIIENRSDINFDMSAIEFHSENENEVAQITLIYMHSIMDFLSGKRKEAVKLLRKVLNDFSFINYFHFELEIKFLLVYLLIQNGEFEQADDLLKKILRKLKSVDDDKYNHVQYIAKAFDLKINKDGNEKSLNKAKENMILFLSLNKYPVEILFPIRDILKKEYQIL